MMAWSRTQEWGEVLDAMDAWWTRAVELWTSIEEQSPDYEWNGFWKDTMRFVNSLNAAQPGYPSDPITECYGRLAGICAPNDHFAVTGSIPDAKNAMIRAQWVIERIKAYAIVAEKPETGEKPVEILYSRHRRVSDWLEILRQLGEEISDDTFRRRRNGEALPA